MALYLFLVLVAFLMPGWAAKIIALALVVGLFFVRNRAISLARNVFLGGEVSSAVEPKLDTAASALANMLDVRYVIMGHTHKPLVRKVREEPDCWYINNGAWLVPLVKERHRGGCRSPLTYLQIATEGVLHHELLRWCQRENKPEPFLPQLPADAEEPGPRGLKVREVTGAWPTPPKQKKAVPKRQRKPPRPSLRKRRY